MQTGISEQQLFYYKAFGSCEAPRLYGAHTIGHSHVERETVSYSGLSCFLVYEQEFGQTSQWDNQCQFFCSLSLGRFWKVHIHYANAKAIICLAHWCLHSAEAEMSSYKMAIC